MKEQKWHKFVTHLTVLSNHYQNNHMPETLFYPTLFYTLDLFHAKHDQYHLTPPIYSHI